jgi:hypothetical protein
MTAETPGPFSVGVSTQASEPQTAAEILNLANLSIPLELPAMGSILAGLTVPMPAGSRHLSSQWTSVDTIEKSTTISASTLITRVTTRHTIERVVRFTDANGSVREHGHEVWQLPDEEVVRYSSSTDFCTQSWGELLRDSLDADSEFVSALSTWDGTIGLRCTDSGTSSREMHLRIYRGRIIDVTRRTPQGATFTFVAPVHTWCDLALGAKNDFMRRAISGEFSSAGNGYEYLRLTKPLNIIIAHVRGLAGSTSREGAAA